MKYIVHHSPWPFMLAMNLGFSAILLINSLHGKSNCFLWVSVLISCASAFYWFKDFKIESLSGQYGEIVWKSIAIGFVLFLISEACYFVALFWCILSNMSVPTLGFWPPTFINVSQSWLPVLGTLLLIGSSFTVTGAHHYAKCALKYKSIGMMVCTITMGISFISMELVEFYLNPFTITDSVYGSIVYMILGTHLSHVIVGLIALTTCTIMLYRDTIHADESKMLDCSIWYWHFVDLIWLFVYAIVY